MNLKNQLQFYLDHREMSASQLAKKAKVPKQSLSGWLAGASPRDINQIKRISEVLETTLDNLLFGEGLNQEQERAKELDSLLGSEWISGLFEIRLRRVKR